jgi:hypothetical protein
MRVLHGRGFAESRPGSCGEPAKNQGRGWSSCWRPRGRERCRLSGSGPNLGHRLLRGGFGVSLMAPSSFPRTDGLGPGLLSLASLEGLDDAHVAHDDGEGVHEGVLGSAEQSAPAPADPADGGIRQRGVGALRRRAPGIGVAMRRPGVVVLLTGLGVDDAIGSALSRDFDPPSSSQGEGF